MREDAGVHDCVADTLFVLRTAVAVLRVLACLSCDMMFVFSEQNCVTTASKSFATTEPVSASAIKS